jgi:hypothetical protein
MDKSQLNLERQRCTTRHHRSVEREGKPAADIDAVARLFADFLYYMKAL